MAAQKSTHSKDRDVLSTDILRTLATKVRFLTCDQVAQGWCADDEDSSLHAAELLKFLHRGRWLDRATIEIRIAGPATEPVFSWHPDDRDPPSKTWEDLAQRLASRWSSQLESAEVFFIASRGASVFGVNADGVGRPCEWSHDYRTTEVYIHFRKSMPAAASRWQGEAARPKWGKRIHRMKDPDVMLLNSDGTIDRIIEIAGKYSAAHLCDLHRHCSGTAFNRLESWRWEHSAEHLLNPYQQIEVSYELW